MDKLWADLMLTQVQWIWFGITGLFALSVYIFLRVYIRMRVMAFLASIGSFSMLSMFTWVRSTAQLMLVMFLTMIVLAVTFLVGILKIGGETPQ